MTEGNVSDQTSPALPITTGIDVSNKENSGNSEKGGRNRSERRGNRSNRAFVDISNKDFEGDTPEIGGVVGLKSEKITAKVQFDTFRDKISDFVLKELQNGFDVIPFVKDMEDPTQNFVNKYLPRNLSDEDKRDDVLKGLFEQKLKKYVDREYLMFDNKVKLYTYIWGQCSSGVKSVIMGENEFKEKHGRKDVLWLLTRIKLVTSGLDAKSNKYDNIYEAVIAFLTMRQGETESNSDYLERFKSNSETVRLMCGNNFFVSAEVLGKNFYTDEERDDSNERLKAMIMIKRSDNKRFGELKKRLRHATDVNRDEYPTTVAGAYDLLVRTQDQIRGSYNDRSGNRFRGGDRTKLMFAQTEDANGDEATMVPGLDGTINPKMVCWHCNKHGHGRDNCPTNPNAGGRTYSGRSSGRRGISNLMRGFQFMQNKKKKGSNRYEGIPASWILLDTCSTVDVTNNPDQVNEIKVCKPCDRMQIITNGGSMRYHHEAEMKLLPIKVHFNEMSMATIISLATILDLKGYYATMDSREELAILVYAPDGKMFKFLQCRDGLYYLDTARADLHIFNYSKQALQDYSNYSMLQTVSTNREFLTKKEIEGAESARREQELIGWPSTSTYKTYVTNNLLNNSNVSIDDVVRAIQIHGEPEPLLEGKMTRPKANIFGKIKRTPLYFPLKDQCQDIQIHVDFFFVQKIPFLHTKSEKLNFLTVERMRARTKSAIIGSINDTLNLYRMRGMTVTFMHGDGEFEMNDLKRAISPTEAIIYGKNEHVPVVERSVRTIKERCRTTCRAAPYIRYTSLMIQHLVESRVKWLNRFPSKNGLSTTLSPAALVLGHGKPDMKIKRIAFGGYALCYTQTSNNMKSRSVPGIALSEANEKGGHLFMSLYTGQKIHAYSWHELPIHDDVIARVEELAEIESQPKLVDRSPLFEWAPGVEILDEEEEINVDPQLEDAEPINIDEQHEGGNVITDDEEEEDDYKSQSNQEQEETEIDEVNHEHDEEEDIFLNGENNVEQDDEVEVSGESQERQIEAEIQERQIEAESEERLEDDQTQERHDNYENGGRRSQRSNAGTGVQRFEPRFGKKSYEITRKKQYMQFKRKKKKVQFAQVKKLMNKVREDHTAPSYLQRAVNIIFAQLEEDEQKFKDMPASRGMKLFGERAVAACIKEFSQLSNGVIPGNPVIEPVNTASVSQEELKQALEAVNLIKQKRCGKVKFRSCANGSEQWKYLTEDENISSPTLQLESLFISLMIDVYEQRDVAIFDIPGAYLHAEMPKDKVVLMKFRGQFAEIMCKVNPAHKENIVYERGKKVLYVRVVRAISKRYALVQSLCKYSQGVRIRFKPIRQVCR